jgi:hypothetical protein
MSLSIRTDRLTWSDHYFCSSHAYWKSDRRSDRNQDPPTDGPMLGSDLRPGNCPTDTRKLGYKLGPQFGPQLGPSDGSIRQTVRSTDGPTVWTGYNAHAGCTDVPDVMPKIQENCKRLFGVISDVSWGFSRCKRIFGRRLHRSIT